MKKLMSVAAIALTFSAFARALPSGEVGAEMMSDPAVMAAMNPKVLDRIGVSDEIRSQIAKEEAESREKLREIQVKGRALQNRHMTLMKAEKPDEAAVMSAIDEVFELRKEMVKIQTRRVLRIKALIPAEQLAKAAEAMKEMRDERRARQLKGAKSESVAKPVVSSPVACPSVKDPAPAGK